MQIEVANMRGECQHGARCLLSSRRARNPTWAMIDWVGDYLNAAPDAWMSLVVMGGWIFGFPDGNTNLDLIWMPKMSREMDVSTRSYDVLRDMGSKTQTGLRLKIRTLVNLCNDMSARCGPVADRCEWPSVSKSMKSPITNWRCMMLELLGP